jgi:uncharacterized protein (TIGR02145 family)
MKNLMKLISLIFLASIIYSCKKDIPTISTLPVSQITDNSAVSGGNVTDDGREGVSARGLVWSLNEQPTIGSNNESTSEGSGMGMFSSTMSGLSPNTNYYVAAYATNSEGTAYGNQISFTTNASLPSLTTQSVDYITIVSAQVDAVVTNNGGATLTAVGLCWDIKPNPIIALNTKTYSPGGSLFPFTTVISRLKPGTTYYVRVYATNSAGTAYGNELSFTTKPLISLINYNTNLTYGSVSDIEGNIYKTIIIGTQTWMAENLKTIKYNNGDLIGTTIPDTLNLYHINDPKYQWAYNGDESLVPVYGRLYTWYAVSDSRNICPVGWHVPAFGEWTILRDYLGQDVAGGKLKESGLAHWYDPNTGATNETGFTALPGGNRWTSDFFYLGFGGSWWSSTEQDGSAVSFDMHYGYCNTGGGFDYKKAGYSVRCVKN